MRIRDLQLIHSRYWDFVDEKVHIQWDNSCLEDLEWWLIEAHLCQGVFMRFNTMDFLVFSDVTDKGWGPPLAVTLFQAFGPRGKTLKSSQGALCFPNGVDEVCAASQGQGSWSVL